MTTSLKSLLLDSSIWVDLFASDRPGREDAQCLVSWAIEHEVALLYAASSLKDSYYLLEESEKRKMRAEGPEVTPAIAAAVNEYAWGCLRAMEEIATAVPLDQSDVWVAMKYRSIHSDFEDNLILAAAERSQADFLVTNDKTLLARSPLATLSSHDLRALVGV